MKRELDIHVAHHHRPAWRSVALPVAIMAMLFQAGVAACSRAWVMPDSGEYIRLAAGILERLDFRVDLFQFRTPGYPVFLAGIFALFGSSSPVALVWIQHMMVAACAVLVAMTAWNVWPHRGMALLAGTLTATSLPLTGYANAALAEVPFTLAMTAALFLLVRFCMTRQTMHLILASVMVGVAMVIKPGGQLLFALAAVFLMAQAIWSREFGQLGRRLVAFLLPAAAMIVPVMLQNGRVHGSYELSCQSKLLWYYRAACVDLLQSSTSPAFAKVQRALEKARAQGWTGPGTRSHHFGPVLNACRRAYGLSMSEASELMCKAGKEMARENLATFASNTMVYTRRLLLMPDNAHRMVAGGEPGDGGTLASGAALYAADTFLPFAAHEADDESMRRYFPVTNEPLPLAGTWHAVVRWVHDHMEAARFPSGWNTTPFEWLAAMSCVGGLLLVVLRRNAATVFVAATTIAYVVLPAFFAGPAPRTIAPIRPVLYLFLACALVYSTIAMRWSLVQMISWFRCLAGTPRRVDRTEPNAHVLDQPT